MPEEYAEDALEKEQWDLDIPSLPLTDALVMLCDHFDLLVMPTLDEYEREGREPINPDSPKALIFDIIDQALESSTQIPHIRRFFEIEELRGH